MNAPRALLALDLDGTLLRHDGTIDPRDVDAVKRAMNAGVAVTIATGRVSTGTVPTARVLGLEHTLVCADGGLLVDPATGARLEQTAIDVNVARDAVAAFERHAMLPFVLLHDALHGDERGAHLRDYVKVWTEQMHFHPEFAGANAWHRDGDIAFTFALGPEASARAVHEHLSESHRDRLDVVSFKASRIDGQWAVLTRPAGCTKGAALARVATRLGIANEHTAVVGDQFNDVPMFRWAKRSFVMGQAPEAVRREATDTLTATSTTGGGVAEAIDRWLSR